MKFPSTSIRAMGSIVALALVGAACGTPTPTPSEGATRPPTNADATLTILVSDFGNERFDPMSMGAGNIYQHPYMATLIDADENNFLAPGIAESWELSPDGLTWTFTIRDDVVFHNGEHLTVDDVVFSLQDTFGQEAKETATGTTQTIALATESIEATGPNTVEVRHSTPLPFFAAAVGQAGPPVGGIFPKAYFEEVGREGFNRAPIGAGPFKVVEIRPGQEITYERFDDYYDRDRLPQFKYLKLQLVPELATRVQALAAGQADIIAADLTVRDQIEQAGNQVVLSPEAAYIQLILVGCWEEQYPCHDKRVRHALDLALDKELIMGQLYGEAWQNVGWVQVTPSALGYSDDLDPRAFDPDEARRLLAEAGYPNGEGFPTLILNAHSQGTDVPLLPEFTQLLAQQWEQELGIATEVRVAEANTLRTQRETGELNGQVYIRDNDARWDGASLARSEYGDLESLIRLSEDPALIAVIHEAEQALTPEDRGEAYTRAYKILHEEGYQIGTGTISRVWGVASRVKGWQPLSLIPRPTALWTIRIDE